jgi:hypothetical protein
VKKRFLDDSHHHIDESGVFVNVDDLVDDWWLGMASPLISRLGGGKFRVKGR